MKYEQLEVIHLPRKKKKKIIKNIQALYVDTEEEKAVK